ncbi:restriction endonuclease subunit S [Lactobacillus sp. ESL0677]|uniref:restriction endonuclease subunit S n=1 Tax=Lactobacillus sp. ESL0677 TaxID=2983208 RepID=UPI0023F7540A|nr:restriction endonuclease subunit S [Lactobacillus sp. ESL0677]WEV36382.1 restriction endonuclease subunit S [Lactobacillus sp. ESL0677]
MSKVTNVPRIRFKGFTNAWEQKEINEIFEVTRGKVLSEKLIVKKKNKEMKYPVYSSQTKNNGLMGYYNKFLFDTAITWTTDGANAGTVSYRQGKFYSTNVNGVLLSSKGYCNLAIACSLNKIAWKYVSKVGNPKLMNNVMKKIKIIIPINLTEQRKLSLVLQEINDLLALQERKLKLYKQLKKYLLQKMFANEQEKVPQIRFKRFDEDWRNLIFKSLCTRITKLSNEDNLFKVEYENIKNNTVGNIKKNVEAKTGILFDKNDILYGKLRPYLRKIVKSDFKGIAVGDFWVLRPKKNSSTFIFYLIQNNKYQRAANISTGTKMPRADWDLISNMNFKVPSLDEQHDIGQFISLIDNIKKEQYVSTEKTKVIKQYLLQNLFC